MQVVPGKVMQRRPAHARTATDVPGPRTLLEAGEPTLVTRAGTITELPINGASLGRLELESVGARQLAATRGDVATSRAIAIRRLLVP